MDNMRKEFEVWCCGRGFTLRPAETDCGVLIDGEYWHPIVQLAWESWKASRAALCVQMPRCCNEEQDSYRLNIIDSLDDAGVRHE